MEASPVADSHDCRLRWSDYLLLAGYCVVLFGFAAGYERVLNPHETVHCLNVREMLASQDWIIPTYGGRPWLERPPLPHWVTALAAAPFGAGEQVWTYRLGSHLAGLACVLLTAWMGALGFGRGMGVLCGAVLATMLEFFVYATVTESDISLCLVVTCAMACFVRAEFGRRDADPARLAGPTGAAAEWRETSFLGKRPWALAGFFFFLGLTNMAKGLFFGSLFILVPVGGYLLATLNLAAIRRYVWLWGWLLALLTASAWALPAWLRYPDIVDLWHSDYVGRMSQGFMKEPAWYYFAQLPLIVFPWFVPALIGLAATARSAQRPQSVERFLWCWAWLPILFFSIPQGKHHHYLLHGLTPWAVLGALGTRSIWQWLTQAPRWIQSPALPVVLAGLGGDLALFLLRDRLPGIDGLLPALLIAWPMVVLAFWWAMGHPRPGVAFAAVFGMLAAAYCLAWVYRTERLNRYREDVAFIQRARERTAETGPIYVKCDLHPLNGSWLLFYLGERTIFLHNLSFLRDEDIREETIYLVGRIQDEEELRKYGHPELIDHSVHTRGQVSERDRYALFRFRYRDDLTRLPASRVRITPCQATGRSAGPYLE